MLITKRGTWWEVLHSWAAADFRAVCADRFLGLFLYRLPGQEQKMAEIRTYLFYYFSNCFCAAEHAGRVYRAAFMGHLHHPRAESAGGLFNTA